jgi:hypothetical protein
VNLRFSATLVMAILLLMPQIAAAQSTPPAIKTFTFDHYLQKDGGTSLTELDAGEQFKIIIAHTCEYAFEYTVFKSPHVVNPAATGTRGVGNPDAPQNPVTTVTKGPITHEAKYGSYLFEVKRKPGNQGKCDIWLDANGTPADPPADAADDRTSTSGGGHWERDVLLPDAVYVVAVETNQWDIGADAALAFVHGVDRQYIATIAPAPAGGAVDPTKKIVTADEDGQSPGRISFGTLTHFYFPKKSNGPAVGFSVINGEENQTQYFFGWGFGLGPKATRLNLAAGAAYVPVPTLPAGIKLNDAITDESKIATLRQVYRWRLFVSFTGTLFRTGEAPKPPARPVRRPRSSTAGRQ